MPRNNRRAGHDYEREEAQLLRESGLFPHVVTSRSENRTRDSQKIDLVNSDEARNGRMEYNIQCKNGSTIQNYHQLLESMPKLPGIINVVFHKFTKKSGNRFMTRGKYAIVSREDFDLLMRAVRGYHLLSKQEGTYQDTIEKLKHLDL